MDKKHRLQETRTTTTTEPVSVRRTGYIIELCTGEILIVRLLSHSQRGQKAELMHSDDISIFTKGLAHHRAQAERL